MNVASFGSDSTFYHLHVLSIPDPSIQRKSHSWWLPAPGYPAINCVIKFNILPSINDQHDSYYNVLYLL